MIFVKGRVSRTKVLPMFGVTGSVLLNADVMRLIGLWNVFPSGLARVLCTNCVHTCTSKFCASALRTTPVGLNRRRGPAGHFALVNIHTLVLHN
jgi:hypothetical protein